MTNLQDLARLAREAQLSSAYWSTHCPDGPITVWANSVQYFIAAASPAVVLALVGAISAIANMDDEADEWDGRDKFLECRKIAQGAIRLAAGKGEGCE